MEAKTKKKVNKTSGRSHGDIIAMIVVLLIIAGYIFYECYSATHVDVETISAVTSTVYETIDAEALVVRDEHTINAKSGGVTVASVKNGEKVKVGGNVAMRFSSEESAQQYAKATELEEQINYYTDLEEQSLGTAADIQKTDEDILNDVNDYIRVINSGRYDDLSDCSSELNEKLARRQMIIGDEIDFSKTVSPLKEELSAIDTDSCQPVGYVTTDQSGIFSSYTDGFESVLDYTKVEDLSAEDLKAAIKKVQSAKPESESFGKLITSYEWYFCCVVDADKVDAISNGDSLNVALKSGDEVMKCVVVSGADPQLNEKETVLILRCSQMNSDITSMRLEDIEIRYNEHKGFKIPSEAIRVDDDGNKFVYALISDKVVRRDGKIIYSTDDYSVFEYEPDNDDSIRFYDQIITKGIDLHDGKIYN